MRLTRLFLIFILCSCLFNLAQAADDPALSPSWQQWVEERHPELDCPWLMSASKQRVCSWPAQFKGELISEGMRFEMQVEVFSRASEVRLPGNQSHWPTQLLVNQQPALVLDKGGKPYVQLSKGRHLITGTYLWSRLPTSLALPDDLALLNIVKNDQRFPTTINNNQLIFAQKLTGTESAKDTLRVEVYRMLSDDVPMGLTTQIKLFVSGKSREVEIGQVSWDNIKTLQLESNLPARLEENGMLRVQVKPGVHEIKLQSRVVGNITSFQTNKLSTAWPEHEYISFASDPHWREVTLTGATSVDTSLVDIPAQWKNLPTYRLQANQALQLTSKTSQASKGHSNTINIRREIWLAFNGQGAVVKDLVRGEMNQGWRLNADSEMQAGRALVNEQAVLITELDGQQGVEIRSPQINLEAVSSLNDIRHFNAVGWQNDVTDFSASIHLPPGWRALHASGVDGVAGTWIQQWNLWDIFWLMILVAVANKLLGVKGAMLMAVTLILSFHEDKAPNLLWALLLLLIGLASLPIGKYKVWVSRFALFPVFILVLSIVVFSVSSLRLALYPSLEKPGISHYAMNTHLELESAVENSFDEIDPLAELSQKSASPLAIKEQQSSSQDLKKLQRSGRPDSYAGVKELSPYQVGENDRVQTGPGVPTWQWNRFYINATGVVLATQSIDVIYSSPWMTALWRVLNVLLLSAMALVTVMKLVQVGRFKSSLDAGTKGTSQTSKNTSSMASIGLLIALASTGTLISEPSQAQDFPPEYLLTEYEARLLAAPDCLPHCVSLDQGHLEIREGQLRLSFNVVASVDVAIALPSAGNTWQADSISLDNQSAILRKDKGNPFIYVAKGQHQVVLQGPILNDQIAISLPLAIHNFTSYTPDWLVDGIQDGVVLKNNIGLVSKKAMAVDTNDNLTPLPVKPYAIVHRKISLGNQWQVETQVEKLSPLNESATFTVALLPGEQVLSGLEVRNDGAVTIQIPNGQRTYVWHSTLPATPVISLQAGKSNAYSERWRVIPSSLWHVNFSGIAAVKSDAQAEQLQPLWKPWAGEQLDIQVQRPEGVSGSVFTTEKATLLHVAGKNTQAMTLKLKVRASQGIDYKIDLAADANIMALTHNGRNLSINSPTSAVVQLHPGEQEIEVKFQLPRVLSWAETSANIQLPGKVSNIDIEFELPRDRWLLFISGPALGASMLYWGMLGVIVLGALALPVLARKLSLTLPVNTMAWVLLGLGFSTVSSYGVVPFALLFFATAYRNQFVVPNKLAQWQFNMLQVGLLLLTFICLVILLLVIPVGLLATPDMQVVGNGSSAYLYKFFQDQVTSGALPLVQVYSLPIWVYRVLMLLWSLWIATQLIKWGKWWFVSYTQGGAWLSGATAVKTAENTASINQSKDG